MRLTGVNARDLGDGRLRACPRRATPNQSRIMSPALERPQPAHCAALSLTEAQDLIDMASKLREAALSGRGQKLLRGKNLGLLCDDDTQPDALLFQRAAAELGAYVAHVAARACNADTPDALDTTARLFGRLYDAIECQGMDAERVRRLARGSDIAVFDGVATPRHPTAALAARMAGADADNRRFVLQAVLLKTFA
jgi:ornithine carbamoyltransferase